MSIANTAHDTAAAHLPTVGDSGGKIIIDLLKSFKMILNTLIVPRILRFSGTI